MENALLNTVKAKRVWGGEWARRRQDESAGAFWARWAWMAAAWVLGASTVGVVEGAERRVDFNREVRPLLSEYCFACHGPDDGKRKAGLRLDRQEDAFKELKSGHRALVAGDLSKSSLYERITTTDADDVMPPPEFGKKLSPAQVALLKRWIEEGAEWKKHWSFAPAERPALPDVKKTEWPRNEIDRFVGAKIESEGLEPNPEADRVTLMRRATLDLTGLPPTIEEVDAYLGDTAPDAYERLVDRLLESRHYGERMAQNWLDLARYADTSGYHFDGVRYMWLWRDWVIQSFNENLPYDQFTVQQLAGDLLPNPTIPQRIATGFVRNNMTNDEGGADPDEYLNKYVVDRVNTLGAVWLGMTVGCGECHDHKYDPISQRDFYRMYAFFHNVPEKGLDRIRTDNPPPRLAVPTVEQAMKFVEADFNLRDAEKTLRDRENELGETREKWEREIQARPPLGSPTAGLLAEYGFEGSFAATAGGESAAKATGATTNVVQNLGAGGRWVVADEPVFEEGRIGKALRLDGKAHADLGPVAGLDRTNRFSWAAWVRLKEGSGCLVSRMEKGPGYRGWDLIFADGRLQVHLISTWPDNALKVKTRDAVPMNQWVHVAVSYEGDGKASGVRIYVNGKSKDLETEKNQLSGSIVTSEPVRVGARNGEARMTGWVDDLRFYDRVLSAEDVRQMVFAGYLPIILKSGGQRTAEQQEDLRRFYRENYAVDFLRSEADFARARKAKDDLVNAIPTAMVMAEMEKPRDTYLLVRGDFRNKGEKVSPGVPAFLPPLPEGIPPNRLALARWLVDRQHPLTSRVTVNRLWALFFGRGLVQTMNDFGSQGEWPSHPELLDWLASHFRDGGAVSGRMDNGSHRTRTVTPWNVKELVRLMVTSATYRQSAAATQLKLERDAYNRWLSRGPRVRLEAEMIRDNALAISGLLNRKIGGASVKPYQPPGIWDGTDASYVQDHGEDLYRRGMYVFWRRSAHYPSFATFDAPNREVCTFVRQRTQTPLQSLVLMNDPVYVEAARGLAQRVLREEPDHLDRRLERAFRHALGRRPEAGELATLRQTFDEQRKTFQENPSAAESLLKVGESARLDTVPAADLAALTAVANVLLNLNETITK